MIALILALGAFAPSAEGRVEVTLLGPIESVSGLEVHVGLGATHGLVVGARGDVFPPPANGMKPSIARVEVVSVARRTLVARLDAPEPGVVAGGLVELRALLPKDYAKEPGAPELLGVWTQAIVFLDNSRRPLTTLARLLHRPGEAQRVLAAMVEAGREVVDQAQKVVGGPTEGRWAGRRVADILAEAGPEDYLDFLRYVGGYPGLYIGKQWKISETFATWLMNRAPAPPAVVARMLWSTEGAARTQRLAALRPVDVGLALTAAGEAAEVSTSLDEVKAIERMTREVLRWALKQPALKERQQEIQARALDAQADALYRLAVGVGGARPDAKRRLEAAKALEEASIHYEKAGMTVDAVVARNNAASRYMYAGRTVEADRLARATLAWAAAAPTQTPTDLISVRLRTAFATALLADIAAQEGRHRDAIALLEPIRDTWRQGGFRGARSEELRILDKLGAAFKALGDIDAALGLHARADQLAQELNDPARRAVTAIAVGGIHFERGRMNEAAQAYEAALGYARSANDTTRMAEAITALAQTHWAAGRWQEALDRHAEARVLYERLNDPNSLAWQLVQVGGIRRDMGDWAGARKALDEALTLRREQGNPSAEADVHLQLGALLLGTGDPPAARAEYEEARRLFGRAAPGVSSALDGLARCAQAERDVDTAERLAEEARAARHKEGARVEEVQELLLLGDIRLGFGRMGEATTSFEEALALAGQAQLPALEARALLGRAYLRSQQGEFQPALDDLARAEAISTNVGGVPLRLEVVSRRTSVLGAIADYQGALAASDQMLALARESKQRPQELSALSLKAWALVDLGRVADAQAALAEATTLAAALDDPVQEGWLENTRANVASAVGDTAAMLAAYDRGIALMRTAKYLWGEAALTFNRALIQEELRDFDGTLTGLAEAERLAGASATSELICLTARVRARVALELGRHADAEKGAREAVALSRQRLPSSLPGALSTLARVEAAGGHLKAALAATGEAAALEREAGRGSTGARGLHGVMLARAGRDAEAQQALEDTLALAGDRPVLWEVPLALGKLKLERGDVAGARAALERSVQEVERPVALLRAGGADAAACKTCGADASARYFADKLEVYRLLVKLLLGQGRADEALKAAERAQELELASTSSGVSTELEVQEARLEALLNDELAAGRGDGQRAQRLDALLAGVKRRRAAYMESLDRQDARFDRYAVRPLQLEKLQEHLPEGALLLSTMQLDDRLIVFAVTRSALTHFETPTTRANLEAVVHGLRTELEVERAEILGAGGLKRARKLGRKLFDAVLAKPFAALGVPKTLLLSTSGALRYVPFAALVDGDGRFVVERSSVLSVTTLDREKFGASHESAPVVSVLALANPDGSLPGAHAEVQAVRAAFAEGEVLEGAAATLAALRTQVRMPGFDVLHLAAHGRLDAAVPERSAILLADRELTYGEIPTLAMARTRLVVLSACSTAVDAGGAGLGIAGLAYQFQRSRVDSVLATLWDVDDAASAALMTDFYERVHGQESFADALAGVQRRFLTEPALQSWRHPAYWAAFTLMGTP